MLALFIALIFQVESAVGAGETGYEALKFGGDGNSYISFTPHMRPFQNAFSVCSWVRNLRHDAYPCVFSYSSSEILTSSDGYHNRIFSSGSLDGALISKFTATQGEWFHQCHTWSLLTRRFSVYFNGQLVGSNTTPSGRTLNTGGRLTIGNHGNGGSSGNAFGGELYQLNVYSKELSSNEVRDMVAGGFCSGGEDLHDDTRQLKWKEILEQTRTGNVRDIESGCSRNDKDLRETESQLNQTERRLNETLSELTQTRREMEETKHRLNTTVQQLNETEEQLDTTTRDLNKTALDLNKTALDLNKTAHELIVTEQQLNSTTRELDEATKQIENMTECVQERAGITKWDLLYAEPFFNKVFTKDLYLKLRSSHWDILEDFVGVTMTDSVINLFKAAYDKEDTVCTSDPDSET